MIETVIKPVNDARPVNGDAKHSRHASNKSSAVAELRAATATPLPYSASNWRYAVATSMPNRCGAGVAMGDRARLCRSLGQRRQIVDLRGALSQGK